VADLRLVSLEMCFARPQDQSYEALLEPGVSALLGVVVREDDDEDELRGGDGGLSFKASAYAPRGNELAMTLGGADAGAGLGRRRDWWAVPLGTVATAERVVAALRQLAGLRTAPPLLRIVLGVAAVEPPADRSRAASAAVERGCCEPGGGGSPLAAHELRAAVRHYCSERRRLDASQTGAVLRAAMAHWALQRATDGGSGGSECLGCGLTSRAGAELLPVQGPPGTGAQRATDQGGAREIVSQPKLALKHVRPCVIGCPTSIAGKTSTIVSLLSVLSSLARLGQAVPVSAPTNAAAGEVARK
jgi:hypothetical protein